MGSSKGWIGYWPAYLLAPIAAGVLAAAVDLGVLRPIRRADMFAPHHLHDLHRHRPLGGLPAVSEHRDDGRSQSGIQ